MKHAYIEALKEFLRVVLIALIPLLIDQLQTGSVDLRMLFVVGSVAGLRFIDKLLHSYGKEVGSETLTKGITRF